MNRSHLISLLLASSCGDFTLPPQTACDRARFNAAFPPDLGEWSSFGQNTARLIADDAGTRITFTTRQFGGRLFGNVNVPIDAGALPRTTATDTGCLLGEVLWWRADLDGELYRMAGTIDTGAIDTGVGADGGVDRSFALELRGLRLTGDAGVQAITSASLVLPVVP